MLCKKALRKIFITTFTLFTLFVIYIIPEKLNSRNYLDVDMDVEYVVSLGTNEIYLLGPNNYLVKTNVLLESETIEGKIKGIIDYLTIKKSEKLPVGLSGIIPENTKLNQVSVTNHIAILDFSEELFQGMESLEERIVEGIVYSILNLDEINGVTLKINGTLVQELPASKTKIPEVIDKSFGINKVYDIDNRNGIQKVTLYYIDQIDNENYYVPVTRYMNDDREKINIIIESLASDYIYESNLMSFLNQDTELIDYQIEDELMLLNFNHSIFSQDKVLEEVSYSIAYSVFDNYDVNTVLLEVEGIEVGKIEKGK
ncbi:MAG TPA: GerMN domain-containing protein [Candidatus Scybalousia intestinigallinarum]|nr:GerMN domain-containing protein [Candidatus Scybalousia intestinigallinarum]